MLTFFRYTLIATLSAVGTVAAGATAFGAEWTPWEVWDEKVRTRFEDAPIPPNHWTVRIEPLDGHARFADVEKKIPRYEIGTDRFACRLTFKNDGPTARSLDFAKFESPYFLSNFFRCVRPDGSGEDATGFSNTDYYRKPSAPWLPSETHPLTTLPPGEEHVVFFNLPIAWTLPMRGKWQGGRQGDPEDESFHSIVPWYETYGDRVWAPRFILGEPGRYELRFRCDIPEGWGAFLREQGVENDCFEGTLEGSLPFEIFLTHPPKTVLLRRVREAIRKSGKPFGTTYSDSEASHTVLYLQCYLAAPEEFEALLLKYRNDGDDRRLCTVYRCLEMFDTPRARAAVERMRNWKPNRLQRAAAWCVGWLGVQRDYRVHHYGPDPIAEYVYYRKVRWYALGMLIVLLPCVDILRGLARRLLRHARRFWRYRKKVREARVVYEASIPFLREAAGDAFRRSRVHVLANDPDGSLASFRAKRGSRGRFFYTLAALSGTAFLVMFVSAFVMVPFDAPLPFGLLAAGFTSLMAAMIFGGLFSECTDTVARERGCWLITRDGITYWYGKDKPRLLRWDEIGTVRLERHRRRGTTVVLEKKQWSADREFRIGERAKRLSDGTYFLPFLNRLLERLERVKKTARKNREPLSSLDLRPLIDYRDTLRKAGILRRLYPYRPLVLFFTPLLVLVAALWTGMFVITSWDITRTPLLDNLHLGGAVLAAIAAWIGAYLSWNRCKRRAESVYRAIRRIPALERKLERGSAPTPWSRRAEPPFGGPPRTITPAARRRLVYTWEPLLGLCCGCWFFPVFGFCLPEILANEKGDAPYAWLALGSLLFLGAALAWAFFEQNRKRLSLLANGRMLRGRVTRSFHTSETVRVAVRDNPDSPFDADLPFWQGACVGDRMTLFVDPSNPRRCITFHGFPRGVHYDSASNTIDAPPHRPLAQILFFLLVFLASLGLLAFLLIGITGTM